MKEKIQSWAINVIGCTLLAGVGAGVVFTYNLYKFQTAYQDNILSSQRQQIEATCEAIAAQEAQAEEPVEEQ